MILTAKLFRAVPLFLAVFLFECNIQEPGQKWTINDQEYLETQGLSVLAFHNFYPSGKQGGIEFIQHGERNATNGFIRMDRINGQRFNYPEPEQVKREVDLNL